MRTGLHKEKNTLKKDQETTNLTKKKKKVQLKRKEINLRFSSLFSLIDFWLLDINLQLLLLFLSILFLRYLFDLVCGSGFCFVSLLVKVRIERKWANKCVNCFSIHWGSYFFFVIWFDALWQCLTKIRIVTWFVCLFVCYSQSDDFNWFCLFTFL